MGGKGLSAESSALVRARMQRLVDDEFGGSVTRAAQALDLSHSILYELLHGTRGPGLKVLQALSDHTGESIEALISGMVYVRLTEEDGEIADALASRFRAEHRPDHSPAVRAELDRIVSLLERIATAAPKPAAPSREPS